MSNNPYRTNDPAGLGRRERLDSGLLGVLGITVDSAAEAAALSPDPAPDGLAVLTAREVVIDADRAEIEAGIDGEALVLPAPVHCRIEPGALARPRPQGTARRAGGAHLGLAPIAHARGDHGAHGGRTTSWSRPGHVDEGHNYISDSSRSNLHTRHTNWLKLTVGRTTPSGEPRRVALPPPNPVPP